MPFERFCMQKQDVNLFDLIAYWYQSKWFDHFAFRAEIHGKITGTDSQGANGSSAEEAGPLPEPRKQPRE